MITDLLHPEAVTVTLVAPGPPDDDGVPTETVTTRPWGPCNIQRSSSTEQRDGREVVTTTLRVSGPLAEWIGEDDRVTCRGKDYRVDGEPAHFKGGALDHTELMLIKWTGV